MIPDLTNIKNIIFDLGNVLLNLDINASIKAFQKLGLSSEVVDKRYAYSDPVFYALEVGKITPKEFREELRRIIRNPLATDQQIDDAWYAMILDFPAKRVKLIRELEKNFNVYLFSNSNQIHIARLHDDFRKRYGFDFNSLFTKDFYSFEIHDRKPDLNSFKKVIELSGVNPTETLFIDDLEPNVLSARKVGFQTLWLKERMEITELFQNPDFF